MLQIFKHIFVNSQDKSPTTSLHHPNHLEEAVSSCLVSAYEDYNFFTNLNLKFICFLFLACTIQRYLFRRYDLFFLLYLLAFFRTLIDLYLIILGDDDDSKAGKINVNYGFAA